MWTTNNYITCYMQDNPICIENHVILTQYFHKDLGSLASPLRTTKGQATRHECHMLSNLYQLYLKTTQNIYVILANL
jgi:hypothetical protein